MPSGGGGGDISVVYNNMSLNFDSSTTQYNSLIFSDYSIPGPTQCDLYLFYISKNFTSIGTKKFVVSIPSEFVGQTVWTYIDGFRCAIGFTLNSNNSNSWLSQYSIIYYTNAYYTVNPVTCTGSQETAGNQLYTVLGIRCLKYN